MDARHSSDVDVIGDGGVDVVGGGGDVDVIGT